MFHLKRLIPLTVLCFSSLSVFSQKIIEGNNAHRMINGSSMIRYVDHRTAPDFILLNKSMDLQFDRALPWVQEVLKMRSNESLELSRVEKDKIGMVHYVYQHKISGVPVELSSYRLHTLNNKVVSLNGEFYQDLSINTNAAIDGATAINSAKAFIGAQEYRWESQTEENFLRELTGNTSATYLPQPELVIVPVNGNYKTPEFRLAWKMDIYASKPLSRNWVYVDAQTGAVIWTVTRICHTDVPATAPTVHSGSRPIIADSFGGGYRLKEAGRGNGIQTFNMNDGTNYGSAVDFTDADNIWNSPAMGIDQYALDAHWGAEMTYDYYWTIHNRNSIDDNGLALISYVHYDLNYDNAFWDGTSMTYGDGDGSFFDEPLTAIEITGHEISHGLTEYTAGLVYQDEPGGLNESFSDIFGVTIDNFARGTTGINLWRMGEESTSNANGLRRMDNPSFFGDPDTYQGTGWVAAGGADNGGVHTNSGVQNYWYYIMCQGATGTNDNGQAYNVTGIGMADAADITFRSLTIYLGANAQFADARFYAIMAAQDLFGGCSAEVITTTNAWYAVGVGPLFVASVNADLASSSTSICNSPASVDFTNLSNNGVTYTWHFGDGGTSTLTNPSHTYTSNGTYNVSLAVDGGTCGSDSVYYGGLVSVNIPASPSVSGATYCANPSVATLNGTGSGTLNWYASPGATTPLFSGNPYITAPLSSTTTFYVEDEIPNGSAHVGPIDNTIGGGSNHSNSSTQYLEFTVLQPITLNTVKVYATGAGNRDILLFDNVGTLLNTITVNIPNGTSNITLNLDLQPGDYRIGGTMMNLYRNSDGAVFPYTLSGLVNITGSSATGRYYFYYDWVVSSSCTSGRVPVTVTITGPAAGFSYNSTGTNVTFTNTSTGATSYFWDFGGGNTSTSSNPSFDFGAPGTYPVMLVATNSGCSDTTYTNVVITQPSGIEDLNFVTNVYPNPFTNYVTLSMQLPASGKELNIEAYNAIGQKVQQIYTGTSVGGAYTYTWNTTESLAPGLYFIKITYDGKQIVKQAIKH
jgi:bacillolysin